MKLDFRTLLLSLAACWILASQVAEASYSVAPTPTELNVSAFGAVPNDSIDDTAAFQTVAKDVASCTTIKIPPGTYLVDNDCFNLDGKTDVVIEGYGAILVPSADWSGKGGGMFNFTNCSRIT